MCYTCGCGLPYNAHGDSRNITEDNFKAAAHTAAIHTHGPGGVKLAKRNMIKLLTLQSRAGELIKPKAKYVVDQSHSS